MKKLVVFALMMFVSSIASTVSAKWVTKYEFPATRLVLVPGITDEIDHTVYSFTDAQGRPSLLFACHGSAKRGEYYASLGEKRYKDYASAIDNEIRYHINRGDIRNTNFEKVYFLTCHAGYAPHKTVTMPVLDKPLQMAIYNKGVQAIGELLDSYGRVYHVILYEQHGSAPGEDGIDDPSTVVDNFFIMAEDSDE